MNLRRPQLFDVIMLLLLAWVLASLARSTGGGSILSNSTWLVYALELLPVLVLGVMIFVTVFLVINAKDISDALGYGMKQKSKLRKKKRYFRIQLIVWTAGWALTVLFLTERCNGALICAHSSSIPVTANSLQQFVSGNGSFPSLPVIGSLVGFANILDTNIFGIAMLGLVIVGGVIFARAALVHLDEVHKEKVEMFELSQQQGREAVRAAIKILDQNENHDPRTRILACYAEMVKAASELGAPVGPDKTARELEKGIRNMFLLKGPGIARLTDLFEEARYSLHQITEGDSVQARACLMEIGVELNRTIMVEA